MAQMRKRSRLTSAPDSALDSEEKVEEAHEEVVAASAKPVRFEDGVNGEMVDKVIDMKGLDIVGNTNYLPHSLEDEKKKMGTDEEMAEINDSGREKNVEKETWEQFLLFRSLLNSASDSARKGIIYDEAREEGDFDVEKNTPQSKDGTGDDYKKKAIDPPSKHDHQALVHDQPDPGSEGVYTILSWLMGQTKGSRN